MVCRLIYQNPRNIAVVRFKGSKLINDTTADEFAEKLVKTYPTTSSTIETYTMRNHQSIQMADGREGVLFYTDFMGSGRKMMQAHVLVSSETGHYLVTYTDVAEHFENPADGTQFLADAWTSMTSIELDSPNPVPSKSLELAILGIISLASIGAGVTLVKKYLAGRQYREYGEMEPGEGAELEPKSAPSGVSLMATAQTKLAYRPSKSPDSGSAKPVKSGFKQKKDNLDELSGESSLDEVQSGFARNVLKFGKKSKDDAVAETDIPAKINEADESDLEFTEDVVKVKLKRGA